MIRIILQKTFVFSSGGACEWATWRRRLREFVPTLFNEPKNNPREPAREFIQQA